MGMCFFSYSSSASYLFFVFLFGWGFVFAWNADVTARAPPTLLGHKATVRLEVTC